MLALYLLSIPFSDSVPIGRQMALVGSPVVRKESGYAERLQEFVQFQKRGILSIAEHISKDNSCLVIDGVPQPTPIGFASDKTPHFVNLCSHSPLNIKQNFTWFRAL
jgi:hypothetical protein